MKIRGMIRIAALMTVVVAIWFASQTVCPALAAAQQQTQPANASQAAAPPPPPPQTAAPPLKSEAKVVRVDVIVTDKKGNYIPDLAAKDFKLYEDNKEQKISNFEFGGASSTSSAADKHYMVLFFDNASMEVTDQPRARAAAAKFVAANGGPDRLIAVVEFGGTLRIVQNFTSDADLLSRAVSGVKFSSVSSNAPAPEIGPASAPLGYPTLNNPEAEFGAYTVLLSIRSLAQNLARIPGRKSLVLFTAGFALTPERESELAATIDACNKANVAIYPLDVRGLVAPNAIYRRPGSSARFAFASQRPADSPSKGSNGSAHLALAAFQRPGGPGGAPGGGGGRPGGGGGVPTGGGGGTGGKGGTGGGSGGGTGGSGGGGKGGSGGGTGGGGGRGTGGGGAAPPRGTPANPYSNPIYTQPRTLIPPIPPSATTNQQVMYELASGTGGFPILNTNDLLAGLQKIGREQNEYYLLGFAPPESADGSCHTLRVKVERHGMEVRSRSGFCTVRPTDVLAGKPIEKRLEAQASSTLSATAGGTLEAPFFYTAPNQARVNLVMEIPASTITFDKVKGKYHADVNVLGIAYKGDGSVGARFSDEVTLDLEKDEWKKFTETPMHYENQFTVAPGEYKLTVVLSGGGQNFGKYETPLAIDPYDGKAFALSAIALSSDIEPLANLGGALDADLLAGRTPLVVKNLEIVPSGSNHFKKSDNVALYAQIYDPHLEGDKPAAVKVGYRVVDLKTGQTLFNTGAIDMTAFVQKGSPVIPVALKIPLDRVPPGSYRVDVEALEPGGATTRVRSATFVED